MKFPPAGDKTAEGKKEGVKKDPEALSRCEHREKVGRRS